MSLVALAFLLVASAGSPAEDVGSATPAPSDVEELYTRLFPAPHPAEEPGPVPGADAEEGSRDGLAFGPVTLRPALILSYVDGDNVFLDSAQPSRDRYFVVQPSLGLRIDALTLGNGSLRASYEPRFRVGSSFEELLKPSHQADALLELSLTPGLTLRVGDHFFTGTVETTEVDPGREYFFGLGRFVRNQIDVGLRIDTGGRLGLDLDASHNRVSFDEETSFFDYDQERGSLTLRYELTPNTRLGLAAGLERVPGTAERPESRSRAQSYGLVLDGDLAPLTNGKIEVGYRDQTSPNAAPGGTRYRGLYARAAATKEFSRGARLTLGAGRATPLSAFEDNGFYVSTSALGVVTFPLPLGLSATAGASCNWNSYRTVAAELGQPRRDRIFGWSAGVGRSITRWCFLRVDYRRDRRDSNLPSVENTSDGFVAQLGLGWLGGARR